jgi:peptidoglycan hydrolase-like protein with peptidoglycan-binding domain
MLAFRGAVITAVVVLATACSAGTGDGPTKSLGEVVTASPDPSVPQPTAELPVPPSTTTTTSPPPPPPWSIGPVPVKGLGAGDRGPQVRAVEERLTALRFDVTVADDVFDQNTGYAVVAFQKVAGLPRTGRVTQDVVDALAATAAPPGPLVPGGGPTRIEIDLPRQVLFLYHNDALIRIVPVSTGSGKRFCADGRCRMAVTPPGSYRIGYRVNGWDQSPLGRLFNPLYFMVGVGIAIHGYADVPPHPASKGCVRIPLSAAASLPGQVPDDTPVYVLDGKTPPAPAPPPGTET